MYSSVVMGAAFRTGERCASRDESRDERRLLLGGFKSVADEVGYVADQSYVELLTDRLGYVIEVGFIAFRQEHGGEAGSMRREQLLLDAADGQHPAIEGDLTGHADIGAHRPSGRQ